VKSKRAFHLQFASGSAVHNSSWYRSVLSSFVFVSGDKGWASLTPAFPFEEVRPLTGKINGEWREQKFNVVDEFAPELDAFAAAIQTKKPVEPDGRRGHRDMLIVEAIYAPAKRNEPVAIRC
jgi:predicted dehydrogenase